MQSPAAYIYQTASNRTLDYIKRNAREIKLQYYIARIQAATDHSSTEIDLDFREAARLLHDAVDRLAPQRRRVYELAREQGLSHEAIARELGISVHTVRNHMADALREIRAFLRQHGGFTALVLLSMKNIL